MATAVRSLAAFAGVCCAAFVLSPIQIGGLALAVAGAALAMPRRRMAAIEVLAGLAFMAFMFGPVGAGGFALMQAMAAAPVMVAMRGARPVLALMVAAALAGTASVCAAVFLGDLLPTRWAAFAPMAPAFILAAPALALRAITLSTLGRARAEAQRLNALGTLLVALVIGAGIGGLHGAAVGWAAGQLAIPLAMLLLAARRAALALLVIGVLAAGFVAALATGAALAFADASPLAAAPAVVIGLSVYVLALRVHARSAAHRLDRVAVRRPARAILGTDPSGAV